MSITLEIEIDAETEARARSALAKAGMTVDEATRLLLHQVASDGKLPFRPFVPNAETIEAMEAARRGEVITVNGGAEALLRELNAPD